MMSSHIEDLPIIDSTVSEQTDPILRKRLQQALATLPGEQREMLKLYADGYDDKEIAQQLNQPLESVQWDLIAARKRLAEQLEPQDIKTDRPLLAYIRNRLKKKAIKEDKISDAVLMSHIEEALMELPEHYQRILRFLYVEGLLSDDVSSRLAIHKTTIRMLAVKAQQQLLELVIKKLTNSGSII